MTNEKVVVDLDFWGTEMEYRQDILRKDDDYVVEVRATVSSVDYDLKFNTEDDIVVTMSDFNDKRLEKGFIK